MGIMRHSLGWGLVLAVTAACSGSDSGIPLRGPGPGAQPALAAGRSGGATAGTGTGMSSTEFGNINPAPGVVPITPMEEKTDGGPKNPDAGPCEVGQFCGPQGPDPDNCGTLRLEQDVEITRHPGNLLIVFDQSLSMNDPWGDSTKIIAAQQAVQNAIMTLQDSLTVGAIFFPTLGCIPGLPSVAVDPIDSANQIAFQPGPMFLQAWNAHWMSIGGALGVGTPMQEAFDRADVALANAKLTGDVAVVAFTDGQPNCFPDDTMTMIPTKPEPDRAAGWLADKKIKTYVVGLPGALGVDLLNQVAVSGGTMQYIVPDDPMMLEAKLKEVVSETVKAGFNSCSINLKPAADPVEKLQMVVEENGKRQKVDRMLSADAGWSITADGTHVEITGKLCDDAKAGRFQSITFEYGCKDLPPLPPPPRPQ
jgi:hypothetical protein